MTCQQKLRAEGKAYPRTCEECGLGPCKCARAQTRSEMTMREKIARALLKSVDPDENWQTIGDEEKQYLYSLADAVLDAMREPTPEMIAAGRQKLTDQSYGTHSPSNNNVGEVFATMIDAAKGETE